MSKLLILSLLFFTVISVDASKPKHSTVSNAKQVVKESDPGFIEYVHYAELEISRCEDIIATASANSLSLLQQKQLTKKLVELRKEKEELKDELYDYVHFGIGDWKIFRSEFNVDLSNLKSDVNLLDVYQLAEESGKSKESGR